MDDLERRVLAAGAAVRRPESNRIESHLGRVAGRPRRQQKRRVWGFALGGVVAASLAAVLVLLAVLTPTATVTDGGAEVGETPLPLAVLDGQPVPEAEVPDPLPVVSSGCKVDRTRIHRAVPVEGVTNYLTRTAGDGVTALWDFGDGMLGLPECGTPATAVRRVLAAQGYWPVQMTVGENGWSVDALIEDGLTQATFGDVAVVVRDNTLHLEDRGERVDEIVLSGSGARTRRIDLRWLAAANLPGPSVPESGLSLGSTYVPSPGIVEGEPQEPSFSAPVVDDLQRRMDDCMVRNGAPRIPAPAAPPAPQRGFVYDDKDGAASHLCAGLFAEWRALRTSPLGVALRRVRGAVAAIYGSCTGRRFRAAPGPRPLTTEQILEIERICADEVNRKIREAKAKNP